MPEANNPQGIGEDDALAKLESLLADDEPAADAGGEEGATKAQSQPDEGAAETPEPEDTEEPAEEDGQDQPATDEPFYEVQMDGKPVKVPLSELTNGYLRQADYTRKTTEAAERYREAEAEAAQARQERAIYQERLGQLEALLVQSGGQEPDWTALAQQDVSEYWRQRAIWEERQRQIGAVREEQTRVQSLSQLEAREQLKRQLDAGREALHAAVPEWKDQKKFAEAQRELREYGKSLGYSDDELRQAYDHRAIIALRKAMLYDRMQAAKPKPVASKGPQTLSPGASVPAAFGKQARYNQSLKALKQSGGRDLKAAEAAIESLL